MIVIGLTGGIGSGKSAVASLLSELGAVHLDADKLGHEVYRRGAPCWEQVVAEFGEGILDDAGEVDRKKLASVVFGDPARLAKLSSLVQPCIRERVEELIEGRRVQGTQVVVVEAALLIEANWLDMVDEVWVVASTENNVVHRLKANKGASAEDTRARIRSQLSVEDRKRYADVVIENNGSRDALRAEVIEQWAALLKRHG